MTTVKRTKRPVRKKPVLTFLRRQQVHAFYQLCRDGAYVGREQEREAIVEMFSAADRAGAIK